VALRAFCTDATHGLALSHDEFCHVTCASPRTPRLPPLFPPRATVALLTTFSFPVACLHYLPCPLCLPGLITTPLSTSLRPKVAHLRDPARWALHSEDLRKIALAHPSALTTPAATSLALWHWLTGEAGLTEVCTPSLIPWQRWPL